MGRRAHARTMAELIATVVFLVSVAIAVTTGRADAATVLANGRTVARDASVE